MAARPRSATERDFCSTLATVIKIFPTLNQDVVGKTVVDYGCGSGMLSADLATLANVVYAVDIRPEVYAAPHRDNIIIGKPDVVPSNTVDVLISINAFEHYAEPKNVLLH